MKKFIYIYGEFTVVLILLMIFLTAWPFIVIAYEISIWIAIIVSIAPIILFNLVFGKRLRTKEMAYKQKFEDQNPK